MTASFLCLGLVAHLEVLLYLFTCLLSVNDPVWIRTGRAREQHSLLGRNDKLKSNSIMLKVSRGLSRILKCLNRLRAVLVRIHKLFVWRPVSTWSFIDIHTLHGFTILISVLLIYRGHCVFSTRSLLSLFMRPNIFIMSTLVCTFSTMCRECNICTCCLCIIVLEVLGSMVFFNSLGLIGM